jgi:hypothetical protein
MTVSPEAVESARSSLDAPVEYPPDPRSIDPDYWTARKLAEEERPPLRKDGVGGARKLWICCDGCGLQKPIHPDMIVERGHGDTAMRSLSLRCSECGGKGHAKLTWVNIPKVTGTDGSGHPLRYGKPRPGWYDFATGERKGAWD